MYISYFQSETRPDRRPMQPVNRDPDAAVRVRIQALMGPNETKTAFAERTGVPATMLSRILPGSKTPIPITDKQLRKIASATGTHFDYLKTGRGPVRGQQAYTAPTDHEGERLKHYLEVNHLEWADLAQKIGVERSVAWSYQKTARFTLSVREKLQAAGLEGLDEAVFSGVVSEPAKRYGSLHPVVAVQSDTIQVPLLPLAARASFGYQTYLNRPEGEGEFLPVSPTLLYDSVPAERHVVVEVNGDSMEPTMRHGYRMLAYELVAGRYGRVGEVLMVDFRDELIIKRLAGLDFASGSMTLESDNGGKQLRIPFDEIRKVWHVYTWYVNSWKDALL